MDSYTQAQGQSTPQKSTAPHENDRLYADWFRVSGDLDDFIFYGEDSPAVSTR